MVRLNPKDEWVNGDAGIAFVFPKWGFVNCVSAETTQRLAPGDVLVLKRESGAKLHLSNGNETVFWQFSVAMENLFPLFSSNEIPLLQNVTNSLKGPIIHSAAKSLAKECHRLLAEVPAQFDLHHRTQLLRVVGAILAEEFKRTRGEKVGFVRAGDHLMQVFEKLPVDDLLNLSVGELAERFGCSRRHLSRLFHQHFGYSLAALRMEMRLLKAVSLLRDPDAKIIFVAQESGFNHLGLFNACFKKRFGTSPGKWRKATQQTADRAAGDLENRSCPLRINGLCPWTGAPDSSGLPASDIPPLEFSAQNAQIAAKAKGTLIAPRPDQSGLGDRAKSKPRP